MKKILKFTALLTAAVLTLLALASCSAPTGNVAKKGTATIVIEGADDYQTYSVDLSELTERDEGAYTLIKHVSEKENSTLYYSVSAGGGYGAYIISIGSLYPDASCEYISVYTSCEKDFAVPTEYMPTVSTVDYNGKTLTYSGVGISRMTIEDGTIVLFRIEKF